MDARTVKVPALVLALALAASCSGSEEEASPRSDRVRVLALREDPCVLASDVDVADALEAPIIAIAELSAEGIVTQTCRYVVDPTGTPPRDGIPTTAPTTTTTAPGQTPDPELPPDLVTEAEPLSLTLEFRVGAAPGDPERLLPTSEAVADLGDEARASSARAERGPRLAVRSGGILLLLEVGPSPLDPQALIAQMEAVARVALEVAPDLEPAEPAEVADDDPCTILADAVEDGAFGEGATVSPLGATDCTLLAASGERATVSAAEADDAADLVAALEQTTDGTAWERTEVDDLGDAATWLDDPAAPGTGLLAVADGDRLLRIEVRALGATPEQARAAATEVAAAVLA
jgi:hypothetical protein